jgi:hypothetical protein
MLVAHGQRRLSYYYQNTWLVGWLVVVVVVVVVVLVVVVVAAVFVVVVVVGKFSCNEINERSTYDHTTGVHKPERTRDQRTEISQANRWCCCL